MTHKEDLLRIFREAGIQYNLKEDNGFNDITLIAGNHGVTGNMGFFATFDFDEDGNLKEVGVWE